MRQFADVAWPAVRPQGRKGSVRESFRAFSVASLRTGEKAHGQGLDVIQACTQRRQDDLHRVQAKQQVLAKQALVTELVGADVGR